MARAALDYRVRLAPQARENTRHPAVFLEDLAAGDPRRPARLEGLRFPWESALSGAEQNSPSDENHVVGDIATAFVQCVGHKLFILSNDEEKSHVCICAMARRAVNVCLRRRRTIRTHT